MKPSVTASGLPASSLPVPLNILDRMKERWQPDPAPTTMWFMVGPPGSVATGDYDAEFQNGWTNAGDPYPPVSYHLSEDGKVFCRGAATGGTAGTPIFTLPEDYRPEYREVFVCPTTDGSVCQIQIDPDGTVTQVA